MDISQNEDRAPGSHQTLVSVLPEELIVLILDFLPLPSIGSICQASTAARAAAMSPELWASILRRFYPDVKEDPAASWASPRQRFLFLAYWPGAPKTHVRTHRNSMRFFDFLRGTQGHPACPSVPCPCLPSCHGSLLASTGDARCPCVCTRSSALRLTLGQLVPARSGSSSIRSTGFSEMRSLLNNHFDMDYEDLATLSHVSLRGIDALILCTTEGPPLSPDEVHALAEWVRGGGALIVSAFANWSLYEHYASATVGWLGLETCPHAEFLPRLSHTLTKTDSSCIASAQLCGSSSPFAVAASHQFVNTGESLFRMTDHARRLGVVKLTDFGRVDADGTDERLTTLCFYPPGSSAAQKGRVLVCSNYHWLVDASYWNGGTFRRGDNARLLLNFLAGAVAARVNPSR